MIKVGRGVGAGIILNGQLFQGDGYGAGEFGHVSMGSADAPCRCGRVGCLETMTSMRALVDAAGAVEPSITDESGLVAAFLAGVTGIRRIVLDAARELGVAIGWLIGVLNVRHVLLVGPVAAFGDDWLDEVRRSARVERPGTARTRHADRVRPRPRRRGRAGRVGAAHGAAAGPGVGAMIATYEPGLDGPLVAGVDVGGTKTSIVVTDDRDRILYEHVAPTDPSSLVGQIAGLVDDARRQLRQDVAAVGVAIPGHVDADDGSVSMAVNLGIIHLPLGPMLQAELGVPTFIEHDARAAALWLSAAGDRRAAIGAGRASPSWRSGPASRPASSSTGPCSAATTALPARWATSSPIRTAPSARAVCAAASRRSPPVRRSLARPTRRWLPVAAASCRPIRVPQTSSAPAQPATRSRSRSPTEWPTTWPERSDRSS